MAKFAPQITRQRLLIEGYYRAKIGRREIGRYFRMITTQLKLRMYCKPIIFSPAGMGKGENQGYDAFAPLIDSGISGDVWSGANFASIVVYTCKGFDEKAAVNVTRKYFKIGKVHSKSF